MHRNKKLRPQYVKKQALYRSTELLGKANPLYFMWESPLGCFKDEKSRRECEGQLELKVVRESKPS